MINDLKSINHFLHVSQTKNGVVFDPNKDLWDINDANRRIIFDFKKINLESHLQIAINNPQFKLNQIQKKPFEIV